MLLCKVENNHNTLLVELPCKRMLLAEHLASIGVATNPSDIKCTDEEDPVPQASRTGFRGIQRL